MTDLKQKINQRLDILENWMNHNYHLNRPEVIKEHLYSITKFWSILDDEEKDYIHAVEYVLEDQIVWKSETHIEDERDR